MLLVKGNKKADGTKGMTVKGLDLLDTNSRARFPMKGISPGTSTKIPLVKLKAATIAVGLARSVVECLNQWNSSPNAGHLVIHLDLQHLATGPPSVVNLHFNVEVIQMGPVSDRTETSRRNGKGVVGLAMAKMKVASDNHREDKGLTGLEADRKADHQIKDPSGDSRNIFSNRRHFKKMLNRPTLERCLRKTIALRTGLLIGIKEATKDFPRIRRTNPRLEADEKAVEVALGLLRSTDSTFLLQQLTSLTDHRLL